MSVPRQKGTHTERSEASRAKKRKFHGNQFTGKASEADEADEANTSASAKKISASTVGDAVIDPTLGYRIVDFVTVFYALSQYLICATCKGKIVFQESGHLGLGFNLLLKCKCGTTVIHSGPKIHSGYEINRRIIFVMRLLGVGLEGINLFCNYMDICKGISKRAYENTIKKFHTAAENVFKVSCEKGVENEKKENEKKNKPADELEVSGDGSWKKRGFRSLFDDLAKSDLVERCLGGYTQNANESFNAVVWKFAPKHLHSGLKIVEIAAFLAACIFNDGHHSLLQIMNELEITPGKQSLAYADFAKRRRIQKQNQQALLATKEARIDRREQRAMVQEFYEETEGAPGMAD